ncbi:unnamed protein product [Spirodela intermedia]|uniref:Uncharacterized protein n=1 Tax=Spirodela intermedia TaxID=51605 RepID=A0ABN7EA93_SPIIN|nr:unnamed protein product [Spirodela intermedia]
MTTPCPTISWPLMTWKGSDAHYTLKRWRLISYLFLRVYDHSLPHTWLATDDVEGE